MAWIAIIIIVLAVVNLIEKIADKKCKCLRCGVKKSHYCEKCYQDLIAENSRLQLEIKQKEENEKRSKNEII